MARLTSRQRDNLPTKDFVFPQKREYPINDKAHARNALARVSQNGAPSEIAAVKQAVHRKFPRIQIGK